MKSIAAGGHRLHSIQALCAVNIIWGQGQDEVPGPAFFIEINTENLAACESHLIKGENRPGSTIRGCYTQAIGLSGEDGFLILQAAFGLSLALDSKARIRKVVTQ